MNPCAWKAGAGEGPRTARPDTWPDPVQEFARCPVVPCEPAFAGLAPWNGSGSVFRHMNRMVR